MYFTRVPVIFTEKKDVNIPGARLQFGPGTHLVCGTKRSTGTNSFTRRDREDRKKQIDISILLQLL